MMSANTEWKEIAAPQRRPNGTKGVEVDPPYLSIKN